MKSDVTEYSILLFYKYIDIQDPDAFRLAQLKLCTHLELKGRIIIAKEGINATIEGSAKSVEKYILEMKKDTRFSDIDFKTSNGTGKAFPKLSIKVRDEIVSTGLGAENFNPNDISGKYITPKELHELIHSGEEYYIVDMRNDYEQEVGMFEGSLRSGMENFRDLPKTAKSLSHLKDKKVVTVCTGGIRCEKASGYLVKKGFKDVYQLQGGIHRYLEAFEGEDFSGSLYVFDGRVTMDPFKNHTVIGRCGKCGTHTEKYVNCANISCHKHFLCCGRCREEDDEEKAFCSEKCKQKMHHPNAGLVGVCDRSD